MTIDEAIKHSTWLADETILDPLPKYREAIKLGIEALKRQKEEKDTILLSQYNPLPGETKD